MNCCKLKKHIGQYLLAAYRTVLGFIALNCMYMILERLKVDNLLTASLIALENLSHNRKYCGSQKSKYITDKSIRLYLNSINGSIDI